MLLLVRSRSLLLTAFITSGKKGDILHAFDKFELIPRPKQQRNIPSSYLLILIEFCERSQRLNPCTVRYSVRILRAIICDSNTRMDIPNV